MIDYRLGNDLELAQVRELYDASTLGARRPITDHERFATMLRHATLVVTAWEGERLVGIARCLSDYSYVTYVSDLAVRQSHQRRGIGKELLRQVQRAGGEAKILLLAAPAAVDYYPHIGFTHHPHAWLLAPDDELSP